MEVLFGVKVTRAEPTSKRINQIKNVQEAMSILLQNNVCKPVSDIVTKKGYRKATTLVRGEMLLQSRCIHFGIPGDKCNLIGSSYNNNNNNNNNLLFIRRKIAFKYMIYCVLTTKEKQQQQKGKQT